MTLITLIKKVQLGPFLNLQIRVIRGEICFFVQRRPSLFSSIIFPFFLQRWAWPWFWQPAWPRPWRALAAMHAECGSLPAWRRSIGCACFCGRWFLAWSLVPLSLSEFEMISWCLLISYALELPKSPELPKLTIENLRTKSTTETRRRGEDLKTEIESRTPREIGSDLQRSYVSSAEDEARPACAPEPVAIGTEKCEYRGLEIEQVRAQGRNESTPPNAPIDHWPSACNRLDSLPLGRGKGC